MAGQETYGNWLGPPAPNKKLVRHGGIYSMAGKTPPVGDFRPASPTSFEDDYDDVSLSDRGHQADEDLQSQRSKGGTGVYTLAGKPASPTPSQLDAEEPGGGKGRRRQVTSVAVLYVLVAMSLVAWLLLFALAVVKHMEIVEELKFLRLNFSENEATARRELGRLRQGMQRYQEELQDISELVCMSLSGQRRCWSGWKSFGRSCYFFSSDSSSWAEAKEACAKMGAHLVIVDSEPEQNFLRDTINNNSSYWLGVTDQEEEGSWVWINGNRITFSFWNTWKEDKDKEQKDCGTIGPDGIWDDDWCSQFHHRICEKSWNCSFF